MNTEDVSLDEIENLLNQSIKGVHPLFDNETIAEIFSQPINEDDFFDLPNVEKIQSLFSNFAKCKSSTERQVFLFQLPKDDYVILVRTFFHIVENTVLATSTYRH